MSQVRKLADFLSTYGREGDSMLVHMTPNEVQALKLMSGLAGGNLTTNPDTGLPEAFDLKWLLPIAAIAALALTGGAAAPGVIAAGEAGAGAAAGAGLGTAATAAPTLLTGGLAGGAATAGTAAGTVAGTTAATVAPEIAAGLATSGVPSAATAAAADTAATAGLELASIPGTQAGVTAANAAATAPLPGSINAMNAAPSWGSQALQWAADNPLPTMLGLNAVGNAFTPEAPQQEEESSDPENEWRPGEGNVPFQVRGVRSFNPQQISPSGMEQNWISTTPAQNYVRKYAAGGPVGYDQMQQMRMQNMRPYSPAMQEPEGMSARKAQMFGRGVQQQQPLAPVAAPMVMQPARDPSWYVQGFQGNTGVTPTATRMPAFPQGAQLNPQPQFQPLQRPTPQGYAMGGPVGITQGMEVPQMENPAPMGVPRDAPMPQMGGGMGDQELIMMAAQAIKSPTPESQQVLEMFVQKFGPDALQRLSEMVNPPIPENMGRLLKGPGTGTSDSIPAVIDGSQPAALSTGEFVVPAKAVSKLGKGSTDAGAQKLQNMVNKVSEQPNIEDGGVLNI